MMSNAMYYAALGLDGHAYRKPRAVVPNGAQSSVRSQHRGPRALVGRALIGLGELIAADAAAARSHAVLGRQNAGDRP